MPSALRSASLDSRCVEKRATSTRARGSPDTQPTSAPSTRHRMPRRLDRDRLSRAAAGRPRPRRTRTSSSPRQNPPRAARASWRGPMTCLSVTRDIVGGSEPEHFARLRQQGVGIERLGHVQIGARPRGPSADRTPGPWRSAARCRRAGQAESLLRAVAHVEAAHLRHHDVEEHEVRLRRLDRRPAPPRRWTPSAASTPSSSSSSSVC